MTILTNRHNCIVLQTISQLHRHSARCGSRDAAIKAVTNRQHWRQWR